MRRWREALPLIAGTGVLGLLCWWFGLGDVAVVLADVRPSYLALYLFLSVLVCLGYSTRWLALSRALGASSRLRTILPARIAGDAFGSLFPGARVAGDPVRVALVTSGGTKVSLASAGVVVDRVLELMGNTICAVVYLTAFSVGAASLSSQTTRVALGALIAALAALIALLSALRRGHRPVSSFFGGRSWPPRVAAWMAVARDTEDHLIRFFRNHPFVFLSGLAGTLLIEGLILGQLYLLLAAFGVRLDLGVFLMTMVMTGLSRGIPTPAGLGSLEGAQVMLFAATTGEAGLGFVVGMILRLHETFWILIGTAILCAHGSSLSGLFRATKHATP